MHISRQTAVLWWYSTLLLTCRIDQYLRMATVYDVQIDFTSATAGLPDGYILIAVPFERRGAYVLGKYVQSGIISSKKKEG